MKKILAILITITLFACTCALCACDDGGDLTLYVPDGAPALSVAKIINDGKVGNYTVNTAVVTGAEARAKCVSGEADMAVLPTNLAVTVCSQRADYQIFSVNVYGVLYIVGTEHLDSLNELCGQTLYSIGLGNTPEYVFKEICTSKGVDYNSIDIQYKDDASAIIPLIKQGMAKYALIGEPAVTQLKKAVPNTETLFDLQQLWQEASGSTETGYPQASLVVKRSLLTEEFAAVLLQTLQDNYAFATANCAKLNDILQGAGSSLQLDYTEQLIERCNIRAITAISAKADIERYLSTFSAMSQFLPLKDGVIYEANR